MSDQAPYSNETTSREAARAVSVRLVTQKECVLRLLKAASGGLTDNDLAYLMMTDVRVASTRRRALVLEGQVRDSGERRAKRIVWAYSPGPPPRVRSRVQEKVEAERARVLGVVREQLQKRLTLTEVVVLMSNINYALREE